MVWLLIQQYSYIRPVLTSITFYTKPFSKDFLFRESIIFEAYGLQAGSIQSVD